MKIFKLIIPLILFSCIFWTCTDEKDFEGYPQEETPGGVTPPDSVAVTARYAFADTLLFALKSEKRVEIPVVLTEKLPEPLQLKVRVVSTENCQEGSEFSLENECLIPKDSLRGTVVLNINDDQKPGSEMNVVLELEEGQVLAGAGEQNRCRVNISSNAVVFFEKVSFSTWEAANVRPNALEIPIKIAGELTEDARVVLTLKGLEETEGADGPEQKHWELESYTLTLAAGAKSAVVRMFTIDDEEVNEDRIAELRIASVEGGNIAAGRDHQSCRVTVKSEEVAKVVKFAEPEYSVEENVTGNQLLVPVVMDMNVDAPVTVQLKATDGSAVAGSDYRLTAEEVTIAAGDSVVYVPIAITDDRKVTGNRDFQLQIISVTGSNASVSNMNTCRIEIVEDDYEVGFAQAAYEFAENATGKTIRLVCSKAVAAPVVVSLEVESGATAVKGSHFDMPLQATIPAGETAVEVPVTLVPSPYVLGDKSFSLKIVRTDDANVIPSESACVVTIKEIDTKKSIRFAKAEYIFQENESNVNVVVTLDSGLPEDVTVAVNGYNTSYCSGPASITIPKGQTSVNLPLALVDDSDFNANREISLSLGTITYGNMTAADVALGASSTCKLVIANNDLPEWDATIPGYTFAEASGEQHITISLKQAYNADMTVYLSPSGATTGTEIGQIAAVTIPAGSTTADVTVNMMANPLKEPAKFSLQVTKVNNGSYAAAVTVADITPTACQYRKMLGEWDLTCTPNNCNATCVVTVKGGRNEAEILENWNKKLVCEAANLISGFTLRYYINWNNGAPWLMLLEKAYDTPLSFGSPELNNCTVRLTWDKDTDKKVGRHNLTFDATNMVLDWNDVTVGGGLYQNDGPKVNGWWWFQTNTKMTKRKN